MSSIANDIERVGADILALSKKTAPRPAARRFLITEDDISASLPSEYRGAKALKAISDAMRADKTVLISGPPGTGKTRQLWGLVRNWRWNTAKTLRLHDLGESVDYELDFLDEERVWTEPERKVWAQRTIARIVRDQPLTIISESTDLRAHRFDREWLAKAVACSGWLAIDDIGAIEPDMWVKEAIYEISTQRRKEGRGTIYTTNLTPDELRATFGGAIASRLMGGQMLLLDGRDRRTE